MYARCKCRSLLDLCHAVLVLAIYSSGISSVCTEPVHHYTSARRGISADDLRRDKPDLHLILGFGEFPNTLRLSCVSPLSAFNESLISRKHARHGQCNYRITHDDIVESILQDFFSDNAVVCSPFHNTTGSSQVYL